MRDKTVTTNTLLQRLFKTKSVTQFIIAHDENLRNEPFCDYLNKLCAEKDIAVDQVIAKSGIERTYGYQLFNGTRKPSRDKVIQLALAFGLNYDETQNMLKAARKSALYARIERDIVFIYALKNNLTLSNIQMTLEDLKLPLLGKEDRYE